jgi:glutaredoxin
MTLYRPNLTQSALILVLIVVAAIAQAEMYRWVDENGQVHFSDTDPGNGEAYSPPDANIAEPVSGGNELPTVRIYTTQSCGTCKRAKTYMREKGIYFVEYDVEQDPHSRNEFRMLGGRGVPLITVGDQRMQGFSPSRFEQMLKMAQQSEKQ